MSVVFFFSSRRRHTRFKCDWSSDVCSSDLPSNSSASASSRTIYSRSTRSNSRRRCLRSSHSGMIPTRHVNGGRLRSLDPVLWKWINLNLQFAKRTELRDCPWWYNERSSVGLLSAATWACGGLALEEYITRKANTGIHRRGRCDLRIELGRMHFACEAKQLWFHFERRSFSPSQAIVGALNQACSDALNLNP